MPNIKTFPLAVNDFIKLTLVTLVQLAGVISFYFSMICWQGPVKVWKYGKEPLRG